MELTADIKIDGTSVTTVRTVRVIPEEGIPNELEYWGASAVFEADGKRFAVTLYISAESADTHMDNAWNAVARQKNLTKHRSD